MKYLDTMAKLFFYIYIVIILFLCICTLLYTNSDFVNPISGKWYLGIYLFLIVFILHFFFKPNNFVFVFIYISSFSIFLFAIHSIVLFLVYHGNWKEVMDSSFDNPAGYTSSLCAGFPMLLYFLNRSVWKTYCSVFVGLLVFFCVALSESRAGILSMIIMVIVWGMLNVRIRKRIIILILIGIVLLTSMLYFCKKDSADGRILIWKCSYRMIKDRPLLGYGCGGFQANYMNYQANYFSLNPNSSYAMLADNVNTPFNEYILLIVNYGIVGFSFFLFLIYFLLRSYQRNPCMESKAALVCLIGIAVFSCFSYPLSYPFVWVMIIFSIYTIFIGAAYPLNFFSYGQKAVFVIIISLIVSIWVSKNMINQFFWAKIARQSLIIDTRDILIRYNELLPKLKNDYLFLYNYAAVLNYIGHYYHSQQIAVHCCYFLSDYDLQLLMGDNCVKMQQYELAEKHYKHASYMCPVRFVPLYELMKVYQLKGDYFKAKRIARIILNKTVKIDSKRIKIIKGAAKDVLSLNI